MEDENTVKSEVTLKQPYGNSAGTYRRVRVCLQFPLRFAVESLGNVVIDSLMRSYGVAYQESSRAIVFV